MEWVELKLFISSTFRDMYYEREYLVKNVLWELKDFCEARKIILSEIDLRWGVTEYMSKTEKLTILKCLEGIDQSRLFLCFLGQYRGWIPQVDEISTDTLEKYPALSSVLGIRSATEMEIYHELERESGSAHEAVFFKREPLADIPEHLIYNYTNAGIEDEDAQQEAKRAMDLICDDVLPKHGYKPIRYAASFTGDTLSGFNVEGKALSESLLEQLKAKIFGPRPHSLFPEREHEQKLHGIEKTLDEQKRQLYIATRDFVDCGDIGRIEKLWDGSSRSMLLHGEAGCGKSSLFAMWLQRRDQRVCYRFCNVGESLSDVLRSFIEELTGQLFYEVQSFHSLLDKLAIVCADQGAILAIDGLEHFPLLQLTELFSTKGLRIFGSISVGSINDEGSRMIEWANARSISSYLVNSFDNPVYRDALADKYLENYLKALDENQKTILRNKEGSGNPLFLKIVLSELRLFGAFEHLKEELERFGNTPQSAFFALLERLENDFYTLGFDKNRIADLFSALIASENGLSVDELSYVTTVPMEQIHLILWEISPFVFKSRTDSVTLYSLRYNAFSEAVSKRYFQTVPVMHEKLYGLFTSRVNSAGDYSGSIRDLECLYHHAVAVEQNLSLAEDLKYSDACIRLGGLNKLIKNLFNASAGESRKVELLRSFIASRATMLAENPTSLLSLLLLEGGELAGESIAAKGDWGYPFIDFASVKLPHLPQEISSDGRGRGFTLTARKSYDKTFALDISHSEGYIFCWRGGTISVYDTRDLHGEAMLMQIEKGRAEAIFVSAGSSYLAIAYSSGELRVYAMNFENRKLSWYDLTYRNKFLLPESTPVFCWESDDTLLFQPEAGSLCAVQFSDSTFVENVVKPSIDGEITALISRSSFAVHNSASSTLYVGDHALPFDFDITSLCDMGKHLAVAGADGKISILDKTTGGTVFEIPKRIHAKTMVYHIDDLYIFCDTDMVSGTRPVYVMDLEFLLTELSQTNEIFPKNMVTPIVKTGFSPDGKLEVATNFDYCIAAISDSSDSPTAQSSISHVFQSRDSLAVIQKNGDRLYLSVSDDNGNWKDEKYNLKWSGNEGIAIGNARINGVPVYIASEEGLNAFDAPEVMLAGAAGGWMLGESGHVYRIGKDGLWHRTVLQEPRIKMTSIVCSDRWVCVSGVDSDAAEIGLRIYVYEAVENTTQGTLVYRNQFFITLEFGHSQGVFIEGDRLYILLGKDDSSVLAHNGILEHDMERNPFEMVPLPFLHSFAHAAFVGDLLYFVDTAGTLFACSKPTGELLCSVKGMTYIVSIYKAGENAYAASKEGLWVVS